MLLLCRCLCLCEEEEEEEDEDGDDEDDDDEEEEEDVSQCASLGTEIAEEELSPKLNRTHFVWLGVSMIGSRRIRIVNLGILYCEPTSRLLS